MFLLQVLCINLADQYICSTLGLREIIIFVQLNRIIVLFVREIENYLLHRLLVSMRAVEFSVIMHLVLL